MVIKPIQNNKQPYGVTIYVAYSLCANKWNMPPNAVGNVLPKEGENVPTGVYNTNVFMFFNGFHNAVGNIFGCH